MTIDAPRTGPCAPWVTVDDVVNQEWPDGMNTPDPAVAASIAMAASEVLYTLSGSKYTGNCGPVTVRPVARPTDVDTRFGAGGYPSAGMTAGQFGSAYSGPIGAMNRYGGLRPPEVDLGAYPVTEILQVLIDGVLIPSNEWYLQARRKLVRVLPSADAEPTQRYGWPSSNRNDLPDTEEGTFSVTYMYGVAPPQIGVNAAKVLAKQLILNASPKGRSILPQRVTSISRQGVTVSVVDVMDFFSKGLTGVYELDLFITTVNPTKMKLKPLVWSPDIGGVRRMPNGFS